MCVCLSGANAQRQWVYRLEFHLRRLREISKGRLEIHTSRGIERYLRYLLS